MGSSGGIRLSSSKERMVGDLRKKLGSYERLYKISSNKITEVKTKPSRRTGLSALEEIKKNLLLDIKLCSSPQNVKKDKEKYDRLQGVEDEYVKNQRQVSLILSQTKQLMSDTKKISSDLEKIKLMVRRRTPAQIPIAKRHHKNSKLEDRLYKETTDKDLTLKKNQSLKYNINELLKVRREYYKNYISTHTKLASARRKTAELTDEANEAIDSCIAGTTHATFLRNQHDKQNGEYRIALWEYEMKMHHDAGLYGFYGIKIANRALLEEETDRLIRLKKEESQVIEFRFQKARHDLQRLRPFVNLGEDVTGIVPIFDRLEQENFGLFQCIARKNEEIVNKEREIFEMKESIEADLNEKEEKTEELKESLEHVNATIEYQEEVCAEDESMIPLYKETSEVLGHCIRNILLLTSAVGKNPMLSYLGHQRDRVDSKTIELTFSLLEHSIADLLFQRECLEVQKSVEIDGEYLPNISGQGREGKPKSQGGPFEPKIKMASLHQSVDLDEVNAALAPTEKPVPYQEMKESLEEEFRQEDTSNNPTHHITER